MKKFKTATSQNGMTLIEVMAALVIFSIGILALGSLQLNAIGANSSAKQITEATRLLADQIEILMAAEWNSGKTATPLHQGEHLSTAYPPFTLNWKIADTAAPIFKKEIDVKVTWKKGGRHHAFEQSIIRVRD
ncbi:MAG: prepilin-type N-terminal cleavage/methylation domain-containing protein [Desulfobacterales bacterium]|nr:prepilin-type N-terminal cleavage/methylation domain-containing protein [Desulfobacterales bacterium]